jgi:RHS repeat-associated protein
MPPSIFDPNVLVGRVLLTHGPGMDQPLSVIRMHYVADEVLDWPNFAVIPIWNTQGRAPYVMFSDGQRTLAHPVHPNIKLGTWWLLAKEAYGPANNAQVTSPSGYDQVWLGSVMEDQQDASGLLYRRNRYYDPATGRFTQEDPIGLAGGLNLYGFANGDPVSYSDPYGLCPYANRERSVNLDDCPTDTEEQRTTLRVFRAIDEHGGEAGDRAIATTASRRLNVSLRSRQDVTRACRAGAGGCLIESTIILGTDRSDGDLVYETVHEVGHSVNGAGIQAEVDGTVWGMQVFAGLPGEMRTGLWAGEFQRFSTMLDADYRQGVASQYCTVYRARGMSTGNSCR